MKQLETMTAHFLELVRNNKIAEAYEELDYLGQVLAMHVLSEAFNADL
jgi:hypothetical protein